MLFSIIAISFNQPKQLAAFIRSVEFMEFDRSNFEIIIVDDGSIPPLADQVVIPKDLNLKVEYLARTTNSSRARARNAGVNVAIGKFLVFIDGDCMVGQNFLQSYQNYFLTGGDIVLGSFLNLNRMRNLEIITKDFLTRLIQSDPEHREDFRFYLQKLNRKNLSQIHMSWLLFMSRNFAISKKLFVEQNGFDERFTGWGSEDTEFAYRLVKTGVDFELIPNKVIHISDGSDPLCNENRYKAWVKNIGIFYSMYNDPTILLLMCQEKLIFDCFVLGQGWDSNLQISSFQSLKQRVESLNNI